MLVFEHGVIFTSFLISGFFISMDINYRGYPLFNGIVILVSGITGIWAIVSLFKGL